MDTGSQNQLALTLQGGGALGAYQAGVYEALHTAGFEPDWVAGVSIGSVNGAIIAGNPRDRRLERLRAFWEQVTARPDWPREKRGRSKNAKEWRKGKLKKPAK